MLREKNISKIILLLPIFFTVIATFSTLYIAISFLNEHFKYDVQILEKKELQLQKQDLKNKIDNVYNYLSYKKIEAKDRLKERLKSRVHMAHEFISRVYDEKKDLLSEQELRRYILETLRKIRFEKDGYFFVEYIKDENQSISRLIPSSPNLENRNSINLKDAAGKYFVQEAINIVKSKDEGFLEYQWYKLSDKKQYKKISFVKFFKPFDWYIGYGEYLDDFEIEVMEEAKKRLNLFKFDKNEYVWTHNSKYILLQHPYRKKDIGTDDTNLVDKKNTKIIQLFVSKALEKKEGSFVEYYWNKPNENKLTKKIAYIRYFEDWDWVIGTGLYLEDIELIVKNLKDYKEKEIKHILFKSILFVLIILSLVIISSLLISRRVNNSFLSYKRKIEKHKDELEEKVKDKTIELQELNEQLEVKITQRVKELKDKDEILTQQSKMVALGEMIGNIAHQWRQPLSAISTAASGLRVKKEMDILDDDDIIEFSDGIVKNANYLSQVIEDFKNYIKGEKLKIDFDLKEAILHALNIFDSSIHNHNLKIIKNFKNEIVVKNYKNELVQALVNILNNAKDALKKYQENEDDRIIFISTDIIDNKAVIIIQDSGNGITENIINKIFEPYFTTKDKEQGTGLGLYMAYKIITDSMKGDIKVENSIFNYNNKSYKGAKFTIILDLKKE